MSEARHNSVLGRILQWGSVLGIALALCSLLVLLVGKNAPERMPLDAAFLAGSLSWERLLAAAGILLLSLTPLLGLGFILWRAYRTSNARRVRLALSIFLLCALAAATAFFSR